MALITKSTVARKDSSFITRKMNGELLIVVMLTVTLSQNRLKAGTITCAWFDATDWIAVRFLNQSQSSE